MLKSPKKLETAVLMLRSKQVMRDVKERGRDIEGCVKQWTSFVKPNFQRYVHPQRDKAGLLPLSIIKVGKRGES